MSRPEFLQALLDRPLPPLTPARLSDAHNPPYDPSIQAQIADLRVHPLLESALHLMNDDLFSAHFLLRKMQEDEWGKWMHGILHLMEGDIDQNARKWYEQTDESILQTFWPSRQAAIDHLYAVSRSRSARGQRHGSDSPEDDQAIRKTKWDEIVAVMRALEGQYGWKEVDGREAYTKDEAPSHQSMVLGEGYRAFDRAGYRK